MILQECAIDGYFGYYKILSNGEIWALDRDIPTVRKGTRLIKGRRLKTYICHNGYEKCLLMKEGLRKTFFIHRLVISAFLSKQPTPDHQVNHIDGIKTNNSIENLEWITRVENIRHAMKLGLFKPGDIRTKSPKKNHCRKGHERTPENSRLKKNGFEIECRVCTKLRLEKKALEKIKAK